MGKNEIRLKVVDGDDGEDGRLTGIEFLTYRQKSWSRRRPEHQDILLKLDPSPRLRPKISILSP